MTTDFAPLFRPEIWNGTWSPDQVRARFVELAKEQNPAISYTENQPRLKHIWRVLAKVQDLSPDACAELDREYNNGLRQHLGITFVEAANVFIDMTECFESSLRYVSNCYQYALDDRRNRGIHRHRRPGENAGHRIRRDSNISLKAMTEKIIAAFEADDVIFTRERKETKEGYYLGGYYTGEFNDEDGCFIDMHFTRANRGGGASEKDGRGPVRFIPDVAQTAIEPTAEGKFDFQGYLLIPARRYN